MFRLISESLLKDRSIINGNVDSKLIGPMIDEVQEYYILPILGSALYNELGSQVPTLTALNKTLVDEYVIPCMVKYIQYEACVYLGYKMTNANVSQKNTDESTPINLSDTFAIRADFKNKAEFYAEKITKYLRANTTDYPLYLLSGNGIDDFTPLETNYTCGMVLDTCNSCHQMQCRCNRNSQTSPQ